MISRPLLTIIASLGLNAPGGGTPATGSGERGSGFLAGTHGMSWCQASLACWRHRWTVRWQRSADALVALESGSRTKAWVAWLSPLVGFALMDGGMRVTPYAGGGGWLVGSWRKTM